MQRNFIDHEVKRFFFSLADIIRHYSNSVLFYFRDIFKFKNIQSKREKTKPKITFMKNIFDLKCFILE